MSRRPSASVLVALLLVLVLAGGAAAVAVITGPAGAQGRGAAASAPGPLRTGRLDPAAPISFTLLLRTAHGRRLQRALNAVENPRSPRFRSFIDARAFGARFGLSRAALGRLTAALRRNGLAIAAGYPQRTALTVRGTAGSVGHLLGVRFATYADAAGHRWHAPLGRARLPAQLHRYVSGFAGLSSRPVYHPADGVRLGGLTPTMAADAYDVSALHSAGFLGQGMKIAIVSFSDFKRSDPSGFDQHYGIGGPAPQVIPVDGGADSDAGADEANLDIDVVKMIAPDAQILFYEAPGSASSYPDVINRIVADHQVSIISSSWGSCEREFDPSAISANEQALKAATAAGISMFVASGDSGAYDCQRSDLSDHRLTVDSPAASAYAVAVGGTRLNMSPSGTYESESGWDDPLSASGGGGGYTTVDARPSWQSGPGVNPSVDKRGVPDVSADADPGTGWATYNAGNLSEAGGTSAATPFWAASMLLIQQYANRHHAGRIGFADPILYALAQGGQPYPPFHDVTTGSNRYYGAHAGWDPATGLGSPNVDNLARDVVAYLQHHPAG
ncbi:MAG: S53 family peptidase [Solirubrobacteraceae bacterium]